MKVPPSTQAAETASAYPGPTVATIDRREQRTHDEDQLDQHRVEREGARYQLGPCRQSSSGQRDRNTDETGGIAAPAPNAGDGENHRRGIGGTQGPDEQQAGGVHERKRKQGALAAPVDEPALKRSASRAAERECPAQAPAAAKEPLTSCT